MINYILWETCPNAGKEATGLEPHPCIVSLVRIAVFCAHWTEPPRRGAELSLGPRACCLRWRNHSSSPWEVGGKKPPGDGSTTLAPRARFAHFPSCTLGKITSLVRIPYAVLPVSCPPLPARRGVRLFGSWGLHGDAMLPRLRRCWRHGESNHPYRPLAVPSQALDVVARTRYGKDCIRD